MKHIEEIQALLNKHVNWRQQCLNMIASENITSPMVRKVLASDLGHRYTNIVSGLYGGSKYADLLIKKCEELAKQLFKAEYVSVLPLSGHIADLSLVYGLTEIDDLIMITPSKYGGYPLAIERLNRKVKYFPFDPIERNIATKKAKEEIEEYQPKLVFFGASFFPFPHPVAELSRIAPHYVTFDGAHVLGLIAGGKFQDPLREGAQALIASTHKTFWGPQGGLVLSNDAEVFQKVNDALNTHVLLVDNYHLHRIVALSIALAESIEFGKDYAHQVVKNAKTLASALHQHGVKILCVHKDFTESHQVLLDMTEINGSEVKKKLEQSNIIVDVGVRIGTSEVTRLGMKESEMKYIAELIVSALNGEPVKNKVERFVNEYQTIEYCFLDKQEAYSLIDLSKPLRS